MHTISTHMTGKNLMKKNSYLNLIARLGTTILVLIEENVNETIDNYLQNLTNLLEKLASLKN